MMMLAYTRRLKAQIPSYRKKKKVAFAVPGIKKKKKEKEKYTEKWDLQLKHFPSVRDV